MSLEWSGQFSATPSSRIANLAGDKILLPASALEQLLAAAPLITSDPSATTSYTRSFDPFNPYSYAAERQARAQFQTEQRQLPHPLTFRLVNPQNGRAVYAGIREFSAEEGHIELSSFLREALGLENASRSGSQTPEKKTNGSHDTGMSNGVDGLEITDKALPRITVHAKQLPKGTFVKLRPLEAGYDPEDWKSLLEQYMRGTFTTLTNGEVLVVPGARTTSGKREDFRFLVDGFKPEGDGICVVDTDLEVDIEALNEEQARETLRQIAAKSRRAPGTDQGSSPGGDLSLFSPQQGQVLCGEYVDYQIPSWDRSQALELELVADEPEDVLDIFVSHFAPRQRARPREDEHVFADVGSSYPKRIRLNPTNVDIQDAEAIYVSIYAYPPGDDAATPRHYTLRASAVDPNTPSTDPSAPASKPLQPDESICKNCHQYIPTRTLFLHENFCLRNNILCPHCNLVFQKRSPQWMNHWHCPQDSVHGNTPQSRTHHDHFIHSPIGCPSCPYAATSILDLAQHRTSTCPGKPILCQFCHLVVPQEGDSDGSIPNAEAFLSGLTVHELADGARTTECHLCNKIVRLRDMATHLRHHNLERLSRLPPRACRNVNCGRTLDGVSKGGDTRASTRMGQGAGNDIGLCSTCFGPLYVSMYDPEGRALRRRVERRYLQQLGTGCGRQWCRNAFCKTGRTNLGIEPAGVNTKDGIALVKPFLDGLGNRGKDGEFETELSFCVDEASQRRRVVAEMLAAEPETRGGYGFEWCVGALEAEGGDLGRARDWLKGFAPQRDEHR